ncbi:MAG: O-antigen ligase family protein [Candidatus Limnocylindrales bacterium]
MHALARFRGELSLANLAALRGLDLVRVVAAGAAFLCVFGITAIWQHAPYDIEAGPVARLVAGLAPLLMASVAAAAVLRPWPAFVAVLFLTPVFDVPQVSWYVGPVQVISQTIFAAALGVGVALRPRTSGSEFAPAAWLARLRPRRTPDHVAAASIAAFLALAALSTIASPDRGTSATILLHGLLEPAAMAFVLLALRPTRRQLTVLLIALGVSVALGGLLNMAQSIPAMKTLAVMQEDRLYFSRITYFNVGLFGEMLAMALPLLIVALLARRRLNLGRAAVGLLVAVILVCLVSLFLTFSKSAYLATFGGCLVLVLLVVHTWRRRVAIVLATCLVSAVVIPWPAFFLQVAPPLEQAYRNAMVSFMGESRYDSWNPSTLAGQGSLLERWYAARAGVEMAIDHPLLGVGLDQFKGLYIGHYRPPEAKDDLDWAHSMYPEAAAELGLPALALELIIYAAALLALWRVYRAPPDQLARLLAAGLLAALVSWQIVGLAFAGDMYRPWRNMASDYVMVTVLVAASFALYRIARRGAGEPAATAGTD